MTHRVSKNHPNAEAREYTRMQLRVLDHRKLLEAMKLPNDARGRATVAVREPEGEIAKFEVDIADGRATTKPTAAEPDVECEAHHWAMIAMGYVSATTAGDLGLVRLWDAEAARALDVFAQGPAPYCREYF
jgi:predicted acetyltransferase